MPYTRTLLVGIHDRIRYDKFKKFSQLGRRYGISYKNAEYVTELGLTA